MNYSKTFQLSYRNEAKICINIEAESEHNFNYDYSFKSNLKYKDLKNLNNPIQGMLKLKIEIEDWLTSINALSIKSLEFEGSLFLGYCVVKDLLFKNIHIHEVKKNNTNKLPKYSNYIFLKFEEFVEAALSSSFSIFPDTIVACDRCKTPSKSFKIKKNAKLSVIIPTKGESFETLERLFNLISTQIYSTDEIIIVDDNFQKINQLEILIKQHSNMKLIRGRCSGVADARNMGLNQATGELISFVDSDDYVSENFFKIQRFIHFIHPGIAATGTWLQAFGAHTKVYQQWDNFNPLGMRVCLPPAGVLIWKKNAISGLNGFDSNFYEGFEDFELLTRATLNNLLIVVVDSIEYFYQRGQKSLSQSWDYQKELDLLKSVLMNSKKLCEHKYREYLALELQFGRQLNYSSIDLIFKKIDNQNKLRYPLNKYRNNFYLLNIWKVLPKFLRSFIYRLLVEK